MASSFFTPRIAGLGIASEMLLTGRTIPAERAYQAGGGQGRCGPPLFSELPTRPWVLSVIAGVGGLCLRMPRPQGLLDWPPGTDGGDAAPSGPVQVGMVNELVDNPDQMRAAAEKLAKEMLECSHLVRAGHCCRGLARQWFLVWREGRAPAATCPWM